MARNHRFRSIARFRRIKPSGRVFGLGVTLIGVGLFVFYLAMLDGPAADTVFDKVLDGAPNNAFDANAGDQEIGHLTVAAPHAPDAPNAPDAPEDIVCRPEGVATDQLRVQWIDTNNKGADYLVQRQDVSGGSWSNLATVLGSACNDDDVCVHVDANASNNIVYRYRVRADDGNDVSSYTASCREPLVLNDDTGNFRGFYRLVECPDIDNKQVCTQNVNNGSGDNTHMAQMLDDHARFREEYIDLGFEDYAIYDGGKPFPIDLYPCNNGCANSRGIQIPPANLENANYNPATGGGEDYEIFVVGHEGFHKVQGRYGKTHDPFYKWVIEGQARSTEDKVCVFGNSADCTLWDDQIDKYYTGAVQSYLGFPEQGLQDASYIAALFWTYITEQFGTSTAEPSYGMDALVAYWDQNLANNNANSGKDGIGTLDDMFTTLGSSRTFESVFEDFAVANYLKEYLNDPTPAGFERYNYIDEETFTGGTYGTVKLTESGPLAPDDVVFGTTSLQAWGARYFEVDPDPAVPVINFTVETLVSTPHPLYYKLVGIKNNNIIDQWDATGTELEWSISNAPGYDRLALIVASHGNPVNFDYGINLADGLFILTPNAQFPAAVGEATSPEKFILQLQVLDNEGDPVAGIDTSQLTMTVGSTVINPPAVPADDPIIGSSYLAGQYWITVRAPASPGCTLCDLTVAYSSYTDTEADAIQYGPKPDVDNMIVIDRSGSMLGDKIIAAQGAAKLYVDSYSTGDRIGVLSFNNAPNPEYGLTGWTNTTRIEAQDAIDDLDTPEGATANGAALREATELLEGQTSPNPNWAIVLLSDGKDTVEDTDDHIAKYLSEYRTKKKAGDPIPVIHVVAVGDDADGVELSKITNDSGGLFQFLPVPGEAAVAGGNAANAVPLAEGLAEIYRVFAEDVLDEQQVYVNHLSTQTQPVSNLITVDNAASQGIFVVKYSPNTASLPTLGLIPPGGTLTNAVAPTLTAPGHLVWRVPAPDAGEWNLLMRFSCGEECPDDYLVEAALVSDLTLTAFLGVPVEERILGKPMPIVAFLSDIAPLPGATMTALSERTGEQITLFDDGQHGDGAANDGAYGGTLTSTNVPGGYSVVIDAAGTSPFAGPYERRTRLAFYLADADDTDEDRLPDWWEIEHGTDPNVPDANQDPDGDDLFTSQEFTHKTHPLDPDTDDGGENDGSEVNRGADPLFPGDDGGSGSSVTFRPWPGPGRAILRFFFPPTISSIVIEHAPSPTGPFTPVGDPMEPQEEWVDEDTPNDQPACYRVRSSGRGFTATSAIQCTTPKADPHPPHGVVVGMGPTGIDPMQPDPRPVLPKVMTLLLDAEDTPATEEHPVFDGAFLFADAEISGVTEMQISNRADFEGAEWEPYSTTKRWMVDPRADGLATVFVRFRDGAGNISDVVTAGFMVDADLPSDLLFLPALEKSAE